MQAIAEKSWQIPNRLDFLAAVSREIMNWLGELSLSTRARYAALLSIEEMVTNIIKYGYDDRRQHFIGIRVSAEPDHVKLVFEDDGHPFDPTQRPAPDIEHIVESRKPGGLGIELVRRMSERMAYERAGDLNRLTLHIRRLQPDDTQFISLSML